MCLGIPGRIVEITDKTRKLALVDVAGVKREINVACIINEDHSLDQCIGDWVLVHVGFAMSRINEEEAAAIARNLVEARLAACANIVRNIRSIYAWQGKVEDDSEVFMILKTKKSLFDPLSTRIRELHSYDVPEIIALPIIMGSEDYLKWIRESTQ